jgi:hypothetical protein
VKAVLLVLAACTAVAFGPLPAKRATADGLNVVVVVDVTASHHRCPEGVAGLASTIYGTGMAVPSRARTDRALIAPAVPEMFMNGPRSEDRVRVGALARRVFLSQPFAGDSAELKKAWRSVFGLPPVEWLGPSPIWDALGDIVEMLSEETGPRAVILISDGQASGNRRSAADVASAAKRLGVRISAIGEESIASTTPVQTMAQAIGKDPTSNMKRVAEQTGGRFYFDKANVIPGVSCYQLDPGRFLGEAFSALR